MDKVSSLIGGILAKRGLREHAEAAMLTHRIGSWMKEKNARLATIVKVGSLKDGVVILHCDHSIALRECQDLLPDLQAFLSAQPGWMASVRVRVARGSAKRVAQGP